ncbi:MAG: hypothetical protein QM689_05755 [Oscillospiraceae bacterium]
MMRSCRNAASMAVRATVVLPAGITVGIPGQTTAVAMLAVTAGLNYAEIRQLIQTRNIARADALLNNVNAAQRNAEWFFLKGSVYYTKGWTNEAYNHFRTATEMEPSNMEYAAAKNRMEMNSGGYMPGGQAGPYNGGQRMGGCGGTDLCCSMVCADSCCECMGGDLISCC